MLGIEACLQIDLMEIREKNIFSINNHYEDNALMAMFEVLFDGYRYGTLAGEAHLRFDPNVLPIITLVRQIPVTIKANVVTKL